MSITCHLTPVSGYSQVFRIQDILGVYHLSPACTFSYNIFGGKIRIRIIVFRLRIRNAGYHKKYLFLICFTCSGPSSEENRLDESRELTRQVQGFYNFNSEIFVQVFGDVFLNNCFNVIYCTVAQNF